MQHCSQCIADGRSLRSGATSGSSMCTCGAKTAVPLQRPSTNSVNTDRSSDGDDASLAYGSADFHEVCKIQRCPMGAV